MTGIPNVTPEFEARLWDTARIGKGQPLDAGSYIKLETSDGDMSIIAITTMTWLGPGALVVICTV